jgi:hypothetical protein
MFVRGFFRILKCFIQPCFICRPSDSTVPEDAGIEPRTVATLYFHYPVFLLHHIIILSSPNNIFIFVCSNAPLHFLLLLFSYNLPTVFFSPFLFIPGINSPLSPIFVSAFLNLLPFYCYQVLQPSCFNPILHTAWLHNHALTLKRNTAKYYFGQKSSFLHTFLKMCCESRKI